MPAARALLASCALVTVACAGDPAELTIDVRTDWRPSRDFVSVLSETSRGPLDGADPGEVREASLPVTGTEPWLDGVRAAAFDDIERGERYTRVSLRAADGRVIASRTLVLDLDGSFAATVLLTRTCRDVVCPAPAGAPQLSECQGGACVDPRCSPATPEFCPPPMCTVRSDCGVITGCDPADVECIEGYCLCEQEELPDGGPPPMDAGPPDAGPPDGGPPDTGPPDSGCGATESACTNGMDDDCDGASDCADSDCNGATCNDGSACTTADSCRSGACGGTARSCDDGNGCTADSCNPASGCVHMRRAEHSTCGSATLRCCGGACINTRTSAAHCGGCGIRCASGFGCVIYDSLPVCDCTANTHCNGGVGQVCSPTYGLNCACDAESGCPAVMSCVDRPGAINYCTY